MNDTREKLLTSAYNEFYKNGYQGASVATILKEVGINKGSMYHFFTSKKALALAVIEERTTKNIELKYTKVLKNEQSFSLLFETFCSAINTLAYGCPLNKMSQEMVYLDEDFAKALTKVYRLFEDLIEKILLKEGFNEKKARSKAQYIIACYEGALMMYHLTKSREAFVTIISQVEKELLL